LRSLLRLAGWFDECLPALFGVFDTTSALSAGESEAVNSSGCERVSYPCLGIFQGQSPSASPRRNYRLAFLDNRFAVVGQDEVISLPDPCKAAEAVTSSSVAGRLVPFDPVGLPCCLDFYFSTVQGNMRPAGGEHAPLWGSCDCGVAAVCLDRSSSEPRLEASMAPQGGLELVA
jgi:hypothetical protein